jgi:hypothetical protein
MGPLISDFIATEARFGAQNYEPLGVILARRRLGVGYARQSLPRLPLGLFGVELGSLQSKDPDRYGGQAGKLTLTSRVLPQRSTGLPLRADRGAYRLPQCAAERCRGRGAQSNSCCSSLLGCAMLTYVQIEPRNQIDPKNTLTRPRTSGGHRSPTTTHRTGSSSAARRLAKV